MRPELRRAWLLLLSWSLLAAVAGAEEAPTPQANGFIETAYAFATRHPDGAIAGNFYLRDHDTFMLNAAMLRLSQAPPADRNGTGFTLVALAGREAGLVRAAGLDLGEHADITQAFGTVAFSHAGVQVSAGKMATMLGNEVIESVSNPNLSLGSQFVYVENFTDTGVDLAWAGAHGWSARARLVNGWDVVTDNNGRKTVFGKLGWSDATRSIAVLGYTGRELPDSVGGQRNGAELLASASLGKIAATLQVDAGREEALDASWSAAGLWLRTPLCPRLDLALRGDVLDDAIGARTSGALGFPTLARQTLVGATATLVIHAVPGALIRPELRWDHSDLPVFNGHTEQWTAALGMALTF